AIHMPPLRDRREDVPSLAAHFIRKHAHRRADSRPPVQGISREAHQLLISYDWPGNVRELENVIQRAIALGTSQYIQPDELPDELRIRAVEEGELGTWEA